MWYISNKSLIRLSSIKGYCFLVNEPSLPRFAFICLLEPQNPSVVQGIGTNFTTYIALFHPLPPSSALLLLCRYDVVRAASIGNCILPHNSVSLQAHLPLGCLYQPKTRMRHLLRISSGRYSDSLIFLTLLLILGLLVICTPTVSPLPIAKISNIWNRSFLRLVKAL